jgi:hypothetical protein
VKQKASHRAHEGIITWLLDGDASIRWQVMRDLLDSPAKAWQKERAKVVREGWGARLLGLQDSAGTWGGGLYSPKWISTTYTLLMLRDMGMPPETPAAVKGCRLILDQLVLLRDARLSVSGCTCMAGTFVALGGYFCPGDRKLEAVAPHLLAQQMPDGGWNCRLRNGKGASHSSFHTTLNVLDGVREAIAHRVGPATKLREAEARAIELLLMHRLYKSDKTGRVIKDVFTKLPFPPRWHYDVLRGLDYIRITPFIRDKRLGDAFDLLESKRLADGAWPLEHEYGGKTFFRMESRGKPSRWNTLRALRCLRACGRYLE